jgi:tetratricopeptide (TPR) repeat protein
LDDTADTPEARKQAAQIIYDEAGRLHRLALDLLSKSTPDLTIIYIQGTDTVGHVFAPYAPPRQPEISSDEFEKYSQVPERYFQLVDRFLGEVTHVADAAHATIVIASDHGFHWKEDRPAKLSSIATATAAKWHRRQGIYLIRGGGIRPSNGHSGHGTVRQICATLLSATGLPKGEGVAGPPLAPLEASASTADYRRFFQPFAPPAAPEQSTADANEALAKLKALGYIGAGAEPQTAAPESLADPKDFIALFDRLRQANSAVRERRFEEAIPILKTVLAGDPRNAFATLILGSAYMGQGSSREAIGQFRRYLELVPTSSYAHQWIAICHVRLGEREQALREADAALALDPKFTDARVLKAGVLASRGEHAAAVTVLREAIATDPAKPMLRLDLAKVLAEAGRRDEARAEFEAILKLEPTSVPALTGLGAVLAGQGDRAGAEATLRKALASEPAAAQARLNLAQVLDKAGRSAEAAAEYRVVADDEQAPADARSTARSRLQKAR